MIELDEWDDYFSQPPDYLGAVKIGRRKVPVYCGRFRQQFRIYYGLSLLETPAILLSDELAGARLAAIFCHEVMHLVIQIYKIRLGRQKRREYREEEIAVKIAESLGEVLYENLAFWDALSKYARQRKKQKTR